jgi:hypothetical protein
VVGCLVAFCDDDAGCEGHPNIIAADEDENAVTGHRNKSKSFLRRNVTKPLKSSIIPIAANKIWEKLEMEEAFASWREWIKDNQEAEVSEKESEDDRELRVAGLLAELKYLRSTLRKMEQAGLISIFWKRGYGSWAENWTLYTVTTVTQTKAQEFAMKLK